MRELKHRRSSAMDDNWKFNVFLSTYSDANTSITTSCLILKKSFPTFGEEQKQSNKETFNFRLASMAQKRLCLSSLFTNLIEPPLNMNLKWMLCSHPAG